jgi:hypothetical protein
MEFSYQDTILVLSDIRYTFIILKSICSPVNVSNEFSITVRCELINFAFRILLFLFTSYPFTSHIVQTTLNIFAWIILPL